MQIVLVQSSGDQLVLAHGPGRGVDLFMGPMFQGNTGDILTQPIPILKGLQREFKDKGNFASNLAFSVHVEKATPLEAVFFHLRWPSRVPRSGELRFVESDTDGRVLMLRIARAVIESVQMSPLLGVSMIITYVVKGGLMEDVQ